MNTQDTLFLSTVVAVLLLIWLLGGLLLRDGYSLLRRVHGSKRRRQAWEKARPARTVLQNRFPRCYAWLRRRLQPAPFTGLPLTLLLLLALYLAGLIGGLVEAVLEAEEMERLDAFVNQFFVAWHSEPMVRIFSWITTFGGTETLTAVALVTTGFLYTQQRVAYILPLWVVISGSQLMTWVGKYAFARPRPEYLTAAVAYSPSFPSAHSAGSMAVYGFVAFAMVREMRNAQGRYHLAYACFALIMLIGFSRIFLSVHYLSDVAVGFLLGLFWLLVGFALYEYRLYKNLSLAAAGGQG